MENNNRVYELRTYRASEGNLEALVERFRRHTFTFFKKYEMVLEGFWVPVDNTDQKIIYLLSFDNYQSYEKCWKAFKNDPEWALIRAESNKYGDLVSSIESVILQAAVNV